MGCLKNYRHISYIAGSKMEIRKLRHEKISKQPKELYIKQRAKMC